MRELPAIEATYTEIANRFDKQLDDARERNDQQAIDWISRQQQINDSAYFILVWGQLEAKINEACETAIRNRLAGDQWEKRRAWDLHNPDDLRARFEDRAALVLDRRNERGNGYRTTMRYYGQRNMVAHGNSLATGIDVPFVISEIYQIVSEIRT